MIKGILFDLSGVLFTNGLKIGIEKIHQKYALNKEHLHELLDGDFSTDYRLSKISPKHFWQNIADQLFLTDSEIKDIKKIWFDSYQIIPEMLALVDELKSKGIRVYYLSDNPEDRAVFLDKKTDFTSHFNDGVFSFQAKARKPSKQIFEFLLNKIKLTKTDLLYVDDKALNNDVAKEVGLKTYLFTTPEEFKKYLTFLN